MNFTKLERYFLGINGKDEYIDNSIIRNNAIFGNVLLYSAVLYLVYAGIFQSKEQFWQLYETLLHLFFPACTVWWFLWWRKGIGKYNREVHNKTPHAQKRKERRTVILFIAESIIIGYFINYFTHSLLWDFLYGILGGALITGAGYWAFMRKLNDKEEAVNAME
jgi:formate/nitrite transporter FocA (FNT family)